MVQSMVGVLFVRFASVCLDVVDDVKDTYPGTIKSSIFTTTNGMARFTPRMNAIRAFPLIAVALTFLPTAVNAVRASCFITVQSTTRRIGSVQRENDLSHTLRPFQSRVWSLSSADAASTANTIPSLSDVGIVVLAGGTGSRMKASMPKQFLTLAGVPVLHHSLHLFLEVLPTYLRTFARKGPPFVVLVLDPLYQPEYQPLIDRYQGRLVLANPGKERQGSVENGLSRLVEVSNGTCSYVAIHDSARPLVTPQEVLNVVRDAKNIGAAVLGVPCKATIKESADGRTVLRTIPRERLWEVHTPQVIRIDTMLRGLAKVRRYNLQVTDDVSIVEALGGATDVVQLTRGEYTNLKITTPEDMDVAHAIWRERGALEVPNMLSSSSTTAGTGTTHSAPPKRSLLRKLSFWRK